MIAYRMETTTLTVKAANKLYTTQRGIEKATLGVTIRDGWGMSPTKTTHDGQSI